MERNLFKPAEVFLKLVQSSAQQGRLRSKLSTSVAT